MFRFILPTRRGQLDLGQLGEVWRRFGRYSRDHVRQLLVAFLAALVVIAMQLALPLPLKVIFDGVLADAVWSASGWLSAAVRAVAHSPAELLWWACGAILVIAAFDALGCYLRDVSLAAAGQRIVGRIRQDLFAHLQSLPPAVFERRKTGALLARLSGDIQMLRQMLVNAMVIAGQSLLTVVALSAAMLMISPLLAAIALATIPVALLASWRISRRIQAATHKQREKESEVAAIAHDVLGAMAVVQAFNREATEQKRFARENRSTVRAGLKTTRLESQLYRTVSLATAVAMCLILYLGVQAVLAGRLTAGDLLVFISYLRMINKPLRSVAKLTGQLARAAACGQRVAELFAIEPAVRNRPGAQPLPRPRGGIDFEGVTFGYAAALPVLTDVHLRIEPGTRVAIVGPTGAGKSTLIKLLLRFHDPDAGSVRIDGRDLRELTLDSLRRHIGWVHQDTVLFGMSIADNLALGRPDATPEMLEEVARRVRADDFIARLAKGYATVLGQGGASLSGGQRQRLALGRALLREPGILLLDEPATGLDALTRRVVEEAWLSPTNRATTLVICHRLQGMERFDQIVFLNNGRVDATGTHAELISGCPAYAALVAAGQEEAPTLLTLREVRA